MADIGWFAIAAVRCWSKYLSNARQLWMAMLFGLDMLFRRWSWGWLEMVTEKSHISGGFTVNMLQRVGT